MRIMPVIAAGLALALGRVVGRLPERFPAWIRQVPVYAMGSLAAFWCFQRTVLLLR